MADKVTLPAFEGSDVFKAKLKITKAGDGLSEALSLGPKAWHVGDEVLVVLKTKVTDVNHKAEKDTDDLVRIHTAAAVEAVEVEAEDVERFLADARERTRVARDVAKGQDQLPMEQTKKGGVSVVEDPDPALD